MEQNRILIIADFDASVAIWNAIKLHINAMLKNDCIISILVYGKSDEIIAKSEYGNLDIILYESTRSVRNYLKLRDFNYIWCPNIFSVFKIKLLTLKLSAKIIFWIQGILPAESYMRNESYIRKIALEFLEKKAFDIADIYIFVSVAMKEYYYLKYKKIKYKNCIIIPCSSELKYNKNITKIQNSFIYIGGLAPWQCFDEVISIFKMIKHKYTDAILHVITLEKEKAQSIIQKQFIDYKDIYVYSISDRSKLSNILSKFQYGFLIRKDNIVNNVASPIKLAEYLSCGINVIINNNKSYFSVLLQKYNAGYILQNKSNFDDLDLICNPESSLSLYNDYYSEEFIINSYRLIIN